MYKCAMCGEEFEEDWTDEEAQAEMKENFGENISKEDCEVVCDDCYEKIKPSDHPEILALAKLQAAQQSVHPTLKENKSLKKDIK